MVMTDPIADLLTRVRNANQMRHKVVSVPASNLKADILEVFKRAGFILDYKLVNENNVDKKIEIKLKYTKDNERVIKGLKRISKPGLRVYAKAEELPRVLNGLGVAVISTSNGVMTDKEARLANVGGEVLAYIW